MLLALNFWPMLSPGSSSWKVWLYSEAAPECYRYLKNIQAVLLRGGGIDTRLALCRRIGWFLAGATCRPQKFDRGLGVASCRNYGIIVAC